MNTRYSQTIAGLVVGLLALSACATGEWNQELADDFNTEVKSCVEEQGHEYPEGGYYGAEDLLSGTPEVIAFDRCWADLAVSDRFDELGLVAPTEFLEQTTADHFAWWKCIEEDGFERVTDIPLNAEGGYPLEPTAADFGVERHDAAIEAFYQTASTCGDVDIEAFRDPDGTFWYGEPAGECVEHDHDDVGEHEHGCFYANSYPGES